MKISVLFLFMLILGLTSCNTAYKALQTPDDVYYSDGKPDVEGVVKEEDPSNRDMRMRSRDRRWREFDDWSYDPYRYGYNHYYYYNPYYYSYPVFGCYTCGAWGPSFIRNSTPRMTNLGSYYNNDRKVVNVKTGAVTSLSGQDRYNNSNNSRGIFKSSGDGGSRIYSPSAPSTKGTSGSPVFRAPKN